MLTDRHRKTPTIRAGQQTPSDKITAPVNRILMNTVRARTLDRFAETCADAWQQTSVQSDQEQFRAQQKENLTT